MSVSHMALWCLKSSANNIHYTMFDDVKYVIDVDNEGNCTNAMRCGIPLLTLDELNGISSFKTLCVFFERRSFLSIAAGFY